MELDFTKIFQALCTMAILGAAASMWGLHDKVDDVIVHVDSVDGDVSQIKAELERRGGWMERTDETTRQLASNQNLIICELKAHTDTPCELTDLLKGD